MFNIQKFSEILQKISDSYGSISEFAEKSEVNRTYISKYINMKLDSPPTPKILEKIAENSKGITNYVELMVICDYYSGYTLLNEIEKDVLLKHHKEIESFNLTEQQKEEFYKIISSFPTANTEILQERISTFSKEFGSKEDSAYDLIMDMIMCILSEYSENVKKLGNHLGYDSKKVEEDINKEISRMSQSNNFYMCPVYGKISAGQPNWAEECLEGYLPIDPNMFGIINPEECFFLRVDGESMNKEIRNGAYALIRKQDIVENGEICAVLVNGFEATLKKFSKQGDLVILEPISNDPSFTTQVYNKDTQIKILGKYIGKFEINK